MGCCGCRGSSCSVKGVCDRGPGLAGRDVSGSCAHLHTCPQCHISATWLSRALPLRHKCCVCPFLTECNCTENGVCNGGLHGDGFCFCAEGWTGERCETRLGERCSAIPWDPPAVPWHLLPHGCFPRSWAVQAAVQKDLQKGALSCEAHPEICHMLLNFTRVWVVRRKALLDHEQVPELRGVPGRARG